MATEAEIRAEVEELGRLTDEEEQILYSIAMRQEELGRQQTIMLLDDLERKPIYKPMIERELLTYQLYDYGGEGAHKVVNLIVTLKGIRYCIMFADEISAKRKFDVVGNPKKQ